MFRTLVAFTMVFACFSQANAGYNNTPNDKTGFYTDTTRYPINDRYGDPYSNPNRNSFDLRDTGFIKRTIEYDPVTKQYYIA